MVSILLPENIQSSPDLPYSSMAVERVEERHIFFEIKEKIIKIMYIQLHSIVIAIWYLYKIIHTLLPMSITGTGNRESERASFDTLKNSLRRPALLMIVLLKDE